ncbi:MAG: hypothetical protein JWQ76_859 [Ramlibacter sp.]|nr:hypothetical protein [Ramlibacter sp.]
MAAEDQSAAAPATPKRVMGLYDRPFWSHVAAGKMCLQCCDACRSFWYPPAAVCPACLASDWTWTPVSGRGSILSWVVYHRAYLPAYPPPYNVIAVRLEEGPLFMSNLEGGEPEGSWIGAPVRLTYTKMPDGAVLPRFVLDRP